jgi:restriction endonuclease Mrr
MANEQISIGQVQQEMNAAGNRILKYSVQLHHHGLNEHKAVSDKNVQILQQKIQAQIAKWNEKWETVGVSAVRDLYGTVMNEDATKGILVTTADFGPDAYDFVKDKPLTLLNGANLLYLLEKHGHHAKIDIQTAKKLVAKAR